MGDPFRTGKPTRRTTRRTGQLNLSHSSVGVGRCSEYSAKAAGVKAAFHYSSQLQTWSQAGRKPAENLLKTGFYSTFDLSSTCTNQRTCCGSRPAFQQKKTINWLKACRKPAWTCRKYGCKPGRKPGLHLARIMECGLKQTCTLRDTLARIRGLTALAGVCLRLTAS